MGNPSSAPRVASLGEALVDLIQRPDGLYEACAGGSVFNLSRAMALQGLRVDYLNPLSADANGRLLRQALVDSGVRLATPEASRWPTSLALAQLDAAAKASYSFYRGAVADRDLALAPLLALTQSLDALAAVCTGCLALAPSDAGLVQPWLRAQSEAGRVIVVDANLRPVAMDDAAAWRASIRAALALADLVKASDEDLHALMDRDGDPLVLGRELLGQCGATALALTLGARGAVLMLADGRQWSAHDPQALAVTDTVGAGDCFLAGLLACWLDAAPAAGLDLRDQRVEQALAHAVASASLSVMRRGCVPPDRAAVRARAAGVPVRRESTPGFAAVSAG